VLLRGMDETVLGNDLESGPEKPSGVCLCLGSALLFLLHSLSV
jgi:hypothetical protein